MYLFRGEEIREVQNPLVLSVLAQLRNPMTAISWQSVYNFLETNLVRVIPLFSFDTHQQVTERSPTMTSPTGNLDLSGLIPMLEQAIETAIGKAVDKAVDKAVEKTVEKAVKTVFLICF
jgi:hypothetical protein